ncbi:conserved hypothetical protein [delta proteobacterium NaphS2]|nr:conserved hypothetical protein [delta proteobacterium NaphS2]
MTGRVRVQEAFKLALSIMLTFWLALEMDWDMPRYAALAIVVISLGTTGASLQKGVMRILGTTVGLVVGLTVIAVLSQHQWLALGFFCLYFLVIGYFVQFSPYSYAWYVAGFLPPLVWASAYGHGDLSSQTFHYATFRYLETTAGIVIYTLVCALLWPIKAGDQLKKVGAAFLNDVRDLFTVLCGDLAVDPPKKPEPDALQTSVAGRLSQMQGLFQAAYADTPSIQRCKPLWETARINTRALVDALALWHQTIADCRDLDPEKLLPGLSKHLATLDKRLERITALWQEDLVKGDPAKETEDTLLLKKRGIPVRKHTLSTLSHFDRAVFMNFLQQLKILEQATRDLLHSLRIIKGLDAEKEVSVSSPTSDPYESSGWEPQRLRKALFPVLCFIAAYFFWIYVNPPGGPSLPATVISISLSLLTTPISPVLMLIVMLVVMWTVVAPVYFFLMPALSAGFGLLGLIFVYTFVFGYVGAKSPALKLVPILLFVMMTGISNTQAYSFFGLAVPSLMLGLVLIIIAVVHMLWTPSRPERVILGSIKRFFKGCEKVTAAFAYGDPKTWEKGRILRKRYAESFLLPGVRQLAASQKHLDYKLFPDNDPDKVARLIAALHQVIHRFHALAIAFDQVGAKAPDLLNAADPITKTLREKIQSVFKKWARFKPSDTLEKERTAIEKIARNLESRLDAQEEDGFADEEGAEALYAVLGALRGLIQSMGETRESLSSINWGQWQRSRF